MPWLAPSNEVESEAEQTSHSSREEAENWYGDQAEAGEPDIAHRLRGNRQSFQLGESSDASFQNLAIQTPTVSELRAERIRFSAEQSIVVVTSWQRVSLVSSGGPENSFEPRLEGMSRKEESNRPPLAVEKPSLS